MQSDSRKTVAALVVNALIVVMEAWATSRGIAVHGLAGNFVYYTQCSNLLGGVACAVCLVAQVRQLYRNRARAQAAAAGPLSDGGASARVAQAGPLPDDALGRMARLLKYWAACCLLMTLVVVTFVLAPMLQSVGQPGFYLMFVDGAKPITHLIAPLCVLGSYVVFEADRSMTVRQSLVGMVPTLAYAAVAYPCNIARLWDGPYPFLQVWTMPVWMTLLWFAVLLVVAFALCQVPRLLGNALGKRA